VRSPEQILAEARTIAIVGASPKPDRPSHSVMRYLLSNGYRCIPVRPLDVDDVLGIRCVANVSEIDEPVDIVDVFRHADALVEHAREAVDCGARALWLQLGLTSAEARTIATKGGLDYVEDACTAIVHRELVRGRALR
jgi:predicted CoA-binding protein